MLRLQCYGMPGIQPGGLAQVHFNSTTVHAETAGPGLISPVKPEQGGQSPEEKADFTG